MSVSRIGRNHTAECAASIELHGLTIPLMNDGTGGFEMLGEKRLSGLLKKASYFHFGHSDVQQILNIGHRNMRICASRLEIGA